MKNKKMYIRTDANSRLGMGHMMRCWTIAEAFLRTGGLCSFVVADKESAAIISDMGYENICLNSDYQDMEKELPVLLELLQKQRPDCLLIDSYYITHDYMEALMGKTKIIYLGMENGQAYPVDMLINYTIMADRQYYNRHYSKEVKKLLGCNYFPLRKEFEGVQITIKKDVRNIVILTGSTDPEHVAWSLSKEFLKKTHFFLHIVIGAYNVDKEKLYALQEYNHRLYLYENITNMAEIFACCDMAISAGGVTLYELCACGLPTIAYGFADNQFPALHCFGQKQIMLNAGDIRRQYDWTGTICGMAKKLSKDQKGRAAMAKKMLTLVDGGGSRRIVAAIMEKL